MKRFNIAIIGCGEIARYHALMIKDSQSPRITTKARQLHGLRAKIETARKVFLGAVSSRGGTTVPTRDLPIRNDMEDIILYAASDTDEERLRQFQIDFKIPIISSDYRALLGREDIDAALVCVPPYLHAEITIEAARRGKHIFCEKPMALSAEECQRMIEAARSNKVVLQIGYVLRFSSERERIRSAILSGKLGRPVFFREIFNLRSGPSQRWVHDVKLGGGPFWENSHALDFLRYIFGEPELVFAAAGRYKPEGAATSLDTFSVMLTFPSGDKALFTDSYGLKGFGWENVGCRSNHLQIDVVGPKGVIQFPDADLSQALTICHYDNSKDRIEKVPWTSEWGANGYIEELRHFFQCAREGRPSLVPGEEGLRTVRLITAAVDSAQKGEVCRFEI